MIILSLAFNPNIGVRAGGERGGGGGVVKVDEGAAAPTFQLRKLCDFSANTLMIRATTLKGKHYKIMLLWGGFRIWLRGSEDCPPKVDLTCDQASLIFLVAVERYA